MSSCMGVRVGIWRAAAAAVEPPKALELNDEEEVQEERDLKGL